jgi:glycosyltransferase involved in cell wall biosynthesis
MRVALVVGHGVPNPTAGGATLTNWTIATHLAAAGHDVVAVPLVGAEYVDPTGATLEDRVAALEQAGVGVHVLRSRAGDERTGLRTSPRARARRLARPAPELLYPTLQDRDAMREALTSIAPDAVLAYHWEALAALYGVQVAPKLGVAVDLSHLPHLYRWRSTKSVRALGQLQSIVRLQPRLMVAFMNDCAASGDFAAHHAAWLRRHGATGCEYLRTPVPDPLGEDWRARRAAVAQKPPRLLLMGHLRGVATMEGLDLFARGILPRLEDELGADGFEVRLVGGYEPPRELARALDRPSVTFAGHTEDAGSEYLSATAMLVPTPIKLGTRVRILSAFSYGCPVVAHQANALGIPELAHGDNAWLGRRGDDLADGVLGVFRDAALRDRLSDGGRTTFEQLFSPPVAVARIEQILRTISR